MRVSRAALAHASAARARPIHLPALFAALAPLRLSTRAWASAEGAAGSSQPPSSGSRSGTGSGGSGGDSSGSRSGTGSGGSGGDSSGGSGLQRGAARASGRASGRGSMATKTKLKLLCLHGYMQNAEIFRSRVGSLRKALKSRVEFVFVDAPFEAQGLPEEEPDEAGGAREGRSWWQWTDTGPDGRPSKAANYTGWGLAQASLLSALREHQPDGLLGFSQGATAAALLLAHLAEGAEGGPAGAGAGLEPLPPLPGLKVAILVAGFMPRDAAVAELVRRGGAAAGRGAALPACLFVTGTTDVLVPPERTLALAACFPATAVSTLTHGGAHLVPTCSGEFKATLTAFLDAAAAGGPVPPAHTVQGGAVPAVTLSASQSAASLSSTDGVASEPAVPVAAGAAGAAAR